MLRRILLLVLLLAAPAARAENPDGLVRGVDLDLVPAERQVPVRARWFFSPTDQPAAEVAVSAGLAGVERVAILSIFDDRWILEAPADSVAAIESVFVPLGTLSSDESGTAALIDASPLVGAGPNFVAREDLAGDVASTVAFLDSGCDTAHDDLGDPDENDADGFPDAGDAADWLDATDLVAGDLELRIVGWHDATDDFPLAVGPWDDHYHGTTMASAGFGGGRVDMTMTGVAPQGRMVIVKTWNFEGRWERWASDFFLGVEWLLQNAERLRVQACVVGTVWDNDHGFAAAVDALADAGILLIAPVGNQRSFAGWPARVPEAFGVGAATKSAVVAAYSAPAPGLTSPPILDVVAPGGSALVPDGGVTVADNEPNDTYRARTGTSIAAAMVGGAVSVIAEVARESGYPWPTGRDRVSWLSDVLTATAVELAAAEPGALASARLDRGSPDWLEGHGLIQVPAATQVVNNVVWPGDRADFSLDDPTLADAVWAGRVPGGADVPTTLSLIPSSEIDADLYVYEDTGAALRLLGSSLHPGRGVAESVELEQAPSNDLVVVARRVSGGGSVIFTSLQRFGPSSLWPRELRSRQTTQPVAADLDGDGIKELILTNTFAVDTRVHEFVVYDSRGRTFRFFPRSVDSAPYSGKLSSPVVGQVGDRLLIVAGSSFGSVFAVSDSAQVVFQKSLTPGLAIGSPVLWEEGPGARLLFPSGSGIHVVDGFGNVDRVIQLGSPVLGELAVGDLDGDGTSEIVTVTADQRMHAVTILGAPVTGWPVDLGGTPKSPVLVGTSGAPGVSVIVGAVVTSAGDLRVTAHTPDGQALAQSPFELDRDAIPLVASSPIAVARRSASSTEVVLSAALGNYNTDQFYRLWRVRLDDGSVSHQDLVYSAQELTGMLHFSRGLVLDEPRLLELSSSPGLEALQATQFDWSEAFVGNPRRYGSSRQFYEWREATGPVRTALGEGHQLFPVVWGMTPLVTDFEGDGWPDLVVVRDNRVYRSGSRMRWTLDGLWAAERGGRLRAGCLDCEGVPYVAAPERRAGLFLSATPNPFNPRTTLIAQLPGDGPVEWSIFDARGRRIRSWVEYVAASGQHRTVFDGTDARGARLSSGVYFVQLRHAAGTARTRVVLVR